MKSSKVVFALVGLIFLVSCGDNNVQKRNEYRYVDILECGVPIPKKYEELEKSADDLYRFSFFKNSKMYRIFIQKNKVDKYIEQKEFIANHKILSLVAERKTKHLKILESKLAIPNDTNPTTIFYIYGTKTYITLENSNEKELAYLLDYCESTWKE